MTARVCLGLAMMLMAASPTSQAHAQAQQAAPAKVQVPDADTIKVLIRFAVIALHQANVSGNYTVLRDMASINLSRATSAAGLTDAFAALRNSGVDMSRILIVEPKLTQPPVIEQTGMLRLVGFFPTTPEPVNFNLQYEPFQGAWYLFGIGVNVGPPPTPTPAAGNKPAPPASTGSKPKPR